MLTCQGSVSNVCNILHTFSGKLNQMIQVMVAKVDVPQLQSGQMWYAWVILKKINVLGI